MHLNLHYFIDLNNNDILKILFYFFIKQFVNKHIYNQHDFLGMCVFVCVFIYFPNFQKYNESIKIV
jgi:hypothetical protein